MSNVRVLVGTRKGAFILTSDGKREKWEVSGPHFAQLMARPQLCQPPGRVGAGGNEQMKTWWQVI